MPIQESIYEFPLRICLSWLYLGSRMTDLVGASISLLSPTLSWEEIGRALEYYSASYNIPSLSLENDTE